MAKKMYVVKGPGGKCVMNKEQANEAIKKDGYKVIDRYDPRREKLKKENEEDVKEEEKEGELMEEFNEVKSKKDLAEFLDTHEEIEIDPATYDGFYELRAGVKEKIENM